MKNILYTLLLFSSLAFSQSSGITYQAVIYNPNGEELPGADNPYAPLVKMENNTIFIGWSNQECLIKQF